MTNNPADTLKENKRYKVGALPNRQNSVLMIEGDVDGVFTSYYPTTEETKQLADDFKVAYEILTRTPSEKPTGDRMAALAALERIAFALLDPHYELKEGDLETIRAALTAQASHVEKQDCLSLQNGENERQAQDVQGVFVPEEAFKIMKEATEYMAGKHGCYCRDAADGYDEDTTCEYHVALALLGNGGEK